MRITHALNEYLRNAQTIRLHGAEVRQSHAGWEAQLVCRQFAEVVDAAKIPREVSGNRQMVEVAAELKAVPPFDDGKVVGDLVTLLYAVDKRERLAPEEGKARNVHGN